jgi:membrane associated rhomboid family serine protease
MRRIGPSLKLCCVFGVAFALRHVQSQDPLYALVSHRATTVQSQPSSRPWRRRPPSNDGSSTVRRRQPVLKGSYSDKFLEFDTVKNDPRARVFSVDLKSRRPNDFSVTSRLVFFTLATFCLQSWKPSVMTMGMKLSDRILRGEHLYRTITPIFLHGGIYHLFTNMMSLQRVGNSVEKLFGPGRYLATYMAAGMAGNVVSAFQSPNPSVGASGAVFGIVGAYFVFLNRNEWLLGSSGEAITTSIGQTVAMNLLLGYFMPQIDNWAHLGGLVGGGVMAYTFGPRLYLLDVPIGANGETGRIIIDRPICRAPRYLESIPGKVGRQWQSFASSIDTHVTGAMFPNGKPWQTSQSSFGKRRKRLPTRSIKPGKVDD